MEENEAFLDKVCLCCRDLRKCLEFPQLPRHLQKWEINGI